MAETGAGGAGLDGPPLRANADDTRKLERDPCFPVGVGLPETEGPCGQETALRWPRPRVQERLPVRTRLSWTRLRLV